MVSSLIGGASCGKARLTLSAIALALTAAIPQASAAFSSKDIAEARTAMGQIDRGDWSGAYQTADTAHFPLLTKLVEWFDLTRSGSQADFPHYMRFIDQNQDWPSQTLLKKHAEDAITDGQPPTQIIAWFQRFPPQGPNGASRYIDALIANRQRPEAEIATRQFLVDGTMTSAQLIEFAGKYSAMLRPADYELRADRLIWASNTDDATQLLPYLSPVGRAVDQTRIAFVTQSPNAQALLAQLTPDQQNNLGLLYERMRWLRRQNRDSEAIAILAVAPPTIPHPEQWGAERAILARRALENHDPQTAYELSRDHRQATGAALADGEWFSGWVALRFLNDPKAALSHFELMEKTVGTPISLSRAAYWAGRAHEAMGDRALADRDYERASKHIGTFYGQIAQAKLGPSARLTLPPQPAVAGLEERTFDNSELVQVALLLNDIGLSTRGDPFIRRIGELARNPDDALLAMRLAKANKSLAAEVQVAKKLMQGGMQVLADGFPVIAPLGPREPEPALVHAIIRQESLFDANAVSPSGALGLMQLMPGTAKGVAAKLKVKKFSTAQLTADPRLNVTFGADYLAGLVDHFNGSYVMAIAGYNAGPGRVSGWLRDNGDPRPNIEDTIDWIEKIGVYETRNYVQRVMENLEIYRARLAGGSTTNNIDKDLTR
jgi:soluble lytic murein transglycosylase